MFVESGNSENDRNQSEVERLGIFIQASKDITKYVEKSWKQKTETDS